MTVDVAVGAQGPFRFLVDTAADRSAVSRQLAARLKASARARCGAAQRDRVSARSAPPR
jgi:hypothetical protein